MPPTGLIGSARSHPGNVQPGGDLPGPSAVPFGRFVPVVRTSDYWISVYSRMRRRAAGTGRLYLAEYDVDGGLLALTQFAAISAVETIDTRHSLHMGPNAELGRTAWQVDTVKVKVVAQADGSPDMTWDIDAWQVERGRLLTAYAPRPQELIDYQIDVTQIADDAVTTPKLIANAVVAGKIAAGAITADKIEADAVTADAIAAGAIETAAFSATATIALVTNAGAEVVIDADGITITDGALIVSNPGGQVIIDGTSDMFRVAATGTLVTAAIGAAPGTASATTTLALGLATKPASQGFVETSSGLAVQLPRLQVAADGTYIAFAWRMWAELSGASDSKVSVTTDAYNGAAPAYTYRYYLLEQAGI